MELQRTTRQSPTETPRKTKIVLETKGNIKWVTLGDARTHFFHASATVRHKSKVISELATSEELIFQSQRQGEILWQEF